jgi:hypothetical protein
MTVYVQRGSSPWTFASSRRTGEWLGRGSSPSFCPHAERRPVESLNLVQSCSPLCCPVGACVGLGNQSITEFVVRLKLSFCLMKYASKGVVSVKKILTPRAPYPSLVDCAYPSLMYCDVSVYFQCQISTCIVSTVTTARRIILPGRGVGG